MANSNLNTCAVVLLGQGSQLSVLLIRRKFPPFSNAWALPSGFLKAKESTLEACCREVQKETGVRLDPKGGVELTSRKKIGRDPRGEIESVPFMFHIAEDSQLHFDQSTPHGSLGRAGEGIRECSWFPLEKVPELAFDHGAILCEALSLFWPLFPHISDGMGSKAIELPALFGPKQLDVSREIAFYGGSFNPWHEGHEACLNLSGASQIVVIPDSSPWKLPQATMGCRFQSYLKIAQKLKNSPHAVYPGYWGSEKANPTIDWIAKLKFGKKTKPSLALIVGLDNFYQILKWNRSQELLRLLSKLYVIRRALSDSNEVDPTAEILKINPKLQIVHSQPHAFEKISSTEMRNT